MKDKKEIEQEREEMKNDFPLLFGVEKVNPFALPQSYFDDSALNISFRLKLNEDNNNKNDQQFSVPDNYFNELEKKIKSKLRFEDLKQQPFETPADYFNELESEIQNRLFLEKLKSKEFSTPENYFENSGEQIKTKVFLQSLKRDDHFAIPQNYFESFEEDLRKNPELQLQEEAKVISLFTYVKKFRYVAAAAVLIGVTVMAWIILNGQQNEPVHLSQADRNKVMENPELFGIDESTIAAMAAENPELITALDEVPDNISDETLNEIVFDQNVDESLITGE